MKTSKKLNRHRSLRIESLESRELLSVNPLVPFVAEGINEPDCVSPALMKNATTAIINAEVPEGYNAYEWNLVESQGLEDSAKWENGRLVSITLGFGIKGHLDLSGCTNLETLNVGSPGGTYGNKITSLNVSGCTNLKTLHCQYNQITSLDISGCSNLDQIICSDNLLTTLDLSDSTYLTILTCSRNPLISLDVSGLTYLETLNCVNSPLTSLDASACVSLSNIICNDNQLTSLNLFGCTDIGGIRCYGNPLNTLNLGGTNFADPAKVEKAENTTGGGTQYNFTFISPGYVQVRYIYADADIQFSYIPLSTPSNLQAELSASRNVNLTWTGIPEATTYQILYKYPDGSERLLGTTMGTTYTTVPLPHGENTLRVYALAGKTRSADAAEITVMIETTVAPATPTDLKAIPQASRNVNLIWDTVPEATSYQIYWKLADGTEQQLGMTTNTEFITARLPEGSNTLCVYALTGFAKSEAAEVTTTVRTVTAPPAPTNLKASPQVSRNVNLTWDFVTDATAYQVYWVLADGSERLLKTTTDTKYTTARLSVGKNTLRVYALSGDLKSEAAEVTTMVGTVTAPAVPTNFKASPQASRNVNLTWSAVSGATHYQIYWKNTKGKNVVIGTSETASFRTPRVANGSNTFYVYAWAGDVRSKGYATVTTRVGTTVLRPLEAAFVEYSVEYSAEYAEV